MRDQMLDLKGWYTKHELELARLPRRFRNAPISVELPQCHIFLVKGRADASKQGRATAQCTDPAHIGTLPVAKQAEETRLIPS
jgi:hypothetical protein